VRTTVILLLSLALTAPAAEHTFDVVVYGGTAGGVIAAVSAVREGLKTALLEPTAHVGGMVSGGLGWTDYGKKEVIGGYAQFELPSKEEAVKGAIQFMELHRKHWPGWEGETEIRQMFAAEECEEQMKQQMSKSQAG